MVIWKITGDEIGPDGNGAAHFATKEAAKKAIRDYCSWCKENGKEAYPTGPHKVVIRNREQLADALDAAMGYGCS